MLRWEPKDPDEVLEYFIDWAPRLGDEGDTISSATWTLPSGITKAAQREVSPKSFIKFTGGTHGVDYDVGCRIVTTGGLTMDETVRLPVRNR